MFRRCLGCCRLLRGLLFRRCLSCRRLLCCLLFCRCLLLCCLLGRYLRPVIRRPFGNGILKRHIYKRVQRLVLHHSLIALLLHLRLERRHIRLLLEGRDQRRDVVVQLVLAIGLVERTVNIVDVEFSLIVGLYIEEIQSCRRSLNIFELHMQIYGNQIGGIIRPPLGVYLQVLILLHILTEELNVALLGVGNRCGNRLQIIHISICEILIILLNQCVQLLVGILREFLINT